MTNIVYNSISDLFSAIDILLQSGKGLSDCLDMVARYVGTDRMAKTSFAPDHYVRQVLMKNKRMEFVMICRSPNQWFPLHDHASGGCIYRCLQWQILEARTDVDKNPVSNRQLQAGQVTYIDNTQGYHAIANTSKEKAVTLHVYSPPGYISHKV